MGDAVMEVLAVGMGRVQSRGQVTVPAEVREAAQIESGDTFFFRVTGRGEIHVTVIPTHRPLMETLDEFATDEELDLEAVWDEVGRDIAADVLPSGPDASERAQREAAAARE